MPADSPLPQTLIILSGLPGGGKTTLARLLVKELQLPVATWTQVDTQRRYFQPWQPGQALFLDGLNSVGDNFAAAMAFIANPTVRLTGWERCN